MLSVMNTVGTLTFDVGFRGILVVAVGVIVLIGSVALLLSTNSGVRLGSLLALTGLFAWMFLMGIVWSMYGIGYKGPAPGWKVKEVSYNTAEAEITKARTVPNADDLPKAQDFIDKSPNLQKQFANQTSTPTLGALLGVEPELSKKIDTGKDWKLLAASDPQTGDATATAIAFLGPDQQNICPTTADCVVLNAFTTGGKPKRPQGDNSIWARVSNKVTNALTLKNPTHYAVIQVRKAIPQTTLPGAAPPVPQADKDSPVISVIMVRDIGAKRLPSIVLSILMGICFLVCCSVLHHREKISVRNRSEA